jgi:hypothetical protein
VDIVSVDQGFVATSTGYGRKVFDREFPPPPAKGLKRTISRQNPFRDGRAPVRRSQGNDGADAVIGIEVPHQIAAIQAAHAMPDQHERPGSAIGQMTRQNFGTFGNPARGRHCGYQVWHGQTPQQLFEASEIRNLAEGQGKPIETEKTVNENEGGRRSCHARTLQFTIGDRVS